MHLDSYDFQDSNLLAELVRDVVRSRWGLACCYVYQHAGLSEKLLLMFEVVLIEMDLVLPRCNGFLFILNKVVRCADEGFVPQDIYFM